MTDLNQLELDLINAIGGAETAAAVEELRVAALGKSGSISGLLKGMGAMSPDERREQGPMINGLRDRVSSALAARKGELEAAELDARLKAEHVDLTLPSRPRRKGSRLAADRRHRSRARRCESMPLVEPGAPLVEARAAVAD